MSDRPPGPFNSIRTGCINYLGLGWFFEFLMDKSRGIAVLWVIGAYVTYFTRRELAITLSRSDLEGAITAFVLPQFFLIPASILQFRLLRKSGRSLACSCLVFALPTIPLWYTLFIYLKYGFQQPVPVIGS